MKIIIDIILMLNNSKINIKIREEAICNIFQKKKKEKTARDRSRLCVWCERCEE